MVYTSPQLSYPRDATVTDILLDYNFNNTVLEKPAIIDGPSGATVYTYGSLRSSVKKLASHLSQYILNDYPEATVAVLVPNSNHFPVFVQAVLATGSALSAFNPLYKPQEIAHSLNLARPRYIFVDQSFFEPLLDGLTLAKLDYSPEILIWRDEETPRTDLDEYRSFHITHAIKQGSLDFTPKKLTAEQTRKKLAFICFSSGTSGLVKGVRLSHGNIVANIFQQGSRLKGMFTPETVTVLAVPFFHILGLAAFACQFIVQGAPIVVFKRFDIQLLLKAIKRDKITHINVVPPIALELLRNPATQDGDFASVKCLINAAAPLKQNIADQLSRRLHCVITQWYGMTEASPSVGTQRVDEVNVKGTVGQLVPGMELKVMSDSGTECGPGETGELQIRGPNIMQGYIGASQDAMSNDGFFGTGDIGYVDHHGYIYIVDRAKEMIKVKGNQVAPAELEALLLSHPQVEDAAVRGIHVQREASDYPIAFITTKVDATGQDELRKDVVDFVNEKVASYKRLKGGVHVLAEIPRNPSGKILRRLLPDNVPDSRSDCRMAASKL